LLGDLRAVFERFLAAVQQLGDLFQVLVVEGCRGLLSGLEDLGADLVAYREVFRSFNVKIGRSLSARSITGDDFSPRSRPLPETVSGGAGATWAITGHLEVIGVSTWLARADEQSITVRAKQAREKRGRNVGAAQ
jgi:hypothetical protein